MRWYMSVISVLGSLRWEGEDDEFEASMGYTVRSRLPTLLWKVLQVEPKGTPNASPCSCLLRAGSRVSSVPGSASAIQLRWTDVHLGAVPEISVPSVLRCPRLSF